MLECGLPMYSSQCHHFTCKLYQLLIINVIEKILEKSADIVQRADLYLIEIRQILKIDSCLINLWKPMLNVCATNAIDSVSQKILTPNSSINHKKNTFL